MTEQDRPMFASRMIAMAEVFGAKISEASITLYFDTLRGMAIEDFNMAASQLLRQSKFMPKPSEFLEQSGSGVRDRGLLAWLDVRASTSSVGSYCGVLPRCPVVAKCIHAMGGWVALCRSEEAEHFLRSRFVDLFEMYDRSRSELPAPSVIGGDSDDQGYVSIGPAPPRHLLSDKPNIDVDPPNRRLGGL